MIQSPVGYQGDVRIKRYLDFYQAGYGVAMLSSGTTAFSPLSLFAANEPGGWYDPSDLTTLFQDAAGTTPVTAVGQPVGLVLDKSRGLVLGNEATSGAWLNTFTTTFDTFTSSGPEGFTATTTGAKSPRTAVAVNVPAAGWYKIEFTATYSGLTYTIPPVFALAGNPYSGAQFLAGGIPVSGQKNVSYVYATAAYAYISMAFTASGASSITVSGMSAKALPGSHLSQSTAAARPVLRATSRIDYDGTDDKMTATSSGGGTTGFLFVAGINLDAIGATQTIWSDTGTNTGYRVRINSSNQLELAAGNGTAYTTAVTTETLSATTNHVIAAWHDGTNLNVKLGTGGAVASQAFAAASAGSAGFTIGMDNGSVSSQLNGKLYNVVYVKNFAGSLSDVTNTIAYVNGTLT